MAWQYVKGRWWIFVIATVPMMLVGVALIVLDSIADPSSGMSRPWYESLLFLGIFFVFSPIVAILWILGFVRHGQRTESELLQRSIPGRATVVSVSETGLYTNDVPHLELVLDVETGNHPPYRVTHRAHVSLLYLSKVSKGSVVDVHVDSENRDNLLLALE